MARQVEKQSLDLSVRGVARYRWGALLLLFDVRLRLPRKSSKNARFAVLQHFSPSPPKVAILRNLLQVRHHLIRNLVSVTTQTNPLTCSADGAATTSGCNNRTD